MRQRQGIVVAPWDDATVASLNAWQARRRFHPFTCGADQHPVETLLVATSDGWECSDESCDYTQSWAHDFMATYLQEYPGDALVTLAYCRTHSAYVTATPLHIVGGEANGKEATPWGVRDCYFALCGVAIYTAADVEYGRDSDVRHHLGTRGQFPGRAEQATCRRCQQANRRRWRRSPVRAGKSS